MRNLKMYAFIVNCAEFSKKAGDLQTNRTFLWTLTVFQVFIFLTVRSDAENIFTRTEGHSVEIFCEYPDGYQYSSMYFCHHPCRYSDVLIKSAKTGVVVSKGRYSAINTVSARTFSVTIKDLTLKDAGVYYCGVEKWGFDILMKVKLMVNKAVSTRTPASTQDQRSEVTQSPCSTTVTATTADSFSDNSTLQEQINNSTNQAEHLLNLHEKQLVVNGVVLGLILFCTLAIFAILVILRKNSKPTTSLTTSPPEIQISQPPLDQDDHVYDDVLAVYSSARSPIQDDSSAPYSIIQQPAPADNQYNPYSLVVAQ